MIANIAAVVWILFTASTLVMGNDAWTVGGVACSQIWMAASYIIHRKRINP